ncbi:MAG: SRPBCC family protein [Sterolibacteriaceae bacterium]|nr:SRPBCC family protein [Candidatus Methylophosphatis haderslevensis]
MRVSLMAVLLLATTVAWAHGPTRQKVTETVNIKAAPEAVWAKIKDYGAMQDWHPAIDKTVADKGNAVGSTRTLTLKGGGNVVEELESYSDAERKFSYRMKDPGPVPVTNYSSTISVKPGEGGGSVVEWRGAFYRKFMNNDPPPEQNDEAAVKAITGIYQLGLGNLKSLLEKK